MKEKKKPQPLSDEQMDSVAGGLMKVKIPSKMDMNTRSTPTLRADEDFMIKVNTPEP